jgi:arginase family enzyme
MTQAINLELQTAYLWALSQLLRPAGGGIYVVSTGLSQQKQLQQKIYQAPSEDAIESIWLTKLSQIPNAKYVLLGVPSDTGAGFVRGANHGPIEIRQMILKHPLAQVLKVHDVIDIGDIRVVPQLLSEEMIHPTQKDETHLALYGVQRFEHAHLNLIQSHFHQKYPNHPPFNGQLPVSPLGIEQLVFQILSTLSPTAIPITLGGDHSIAWPAFEAIYHQTMSQNLKVGLLHYDAHTDLLEKRLGIKYCFATWAYHANELLNRDGRLIQVGVRASGKTKSHWENTLNVRQYWPEDYQNQDPHVIASEIIQRFKELGVDCVYISNDIDATDIHHASATGTAEAQGLLPSQISIITQRVLEVFPLVGADLVEVAPPLSRLEDEPEKTLKVACDYLLDLFSQFTKK